MDTRPLGFDQNNVLVMPTIWEAREHFEPVRQRLLEHPDILSVSQSNPIPSRRLFGPIEVSRLDGEVDAGVSLVPVWADASFFRTYGIPLVAGRGFRDEIASDHDTGFVLNESAVARLGMASPDKVVGVPLRVGGWRGEVLGVVADFHFESLHQEIAPMVFYMDQRNYRLVSVRISPEADIPEVSAFLETEWQRDDQNATLSVSFLDDRLRAAYDGDRRTGVLVTVFTALAIFITSLGLFGLTSYSVERRTKEMGVRRVLGASTWDLIYILGRGTLSLVMVAMIIAVPVGFVLARNWLDSFAYRSPISVWLLAAVGVAALAMAMTTVSVLALRAARVSPASSLKQN